MTLPIHELRGRLRTTLAEWDRVVVTAPTGSGKSTQIPQMLAEDCCGPGRILVLQPRRLAARMLAVRVAEERGVSLGGEVGYQTRFDSAVSDETRICFITEAILLRRILSDGALRGVAAVVFDEFHERSLASDVGLALARAVLEHERPDLKIVVMSATLAAEPVCDYLGQCPHLHAEGRCYPVEVSYLRRPLRGDVWDAASGALADVLRTGVAGDVLVFMPGVYEIRRTAEACGRLGSSERFAVMPLYGDLGRQEQQRVMAACETRKVIVATNIAETSLTIPGVRHVIDCGLARVSRYDSGRGVNMLVTETISRSSADQRSGRAGREAPGTCRRLWSDGEHRLRPAHTDAEVRRVDLAETVLLLVSLGHGDPAAFPWFEAPPAASLENAVSLLRELRLVTGTLLSLTELGHRAIRIPAHPRLSTLMCHADGVGCFEEAALAAAILSERPLPVTRKGGRGTLRDAVRNTPGGAAADREREHMPSDLFALFHALHQAERAHFSRDACSRLGISGVAARDVWRTFRALVAAGRRHGLGASRGVRDTEGFLMSVLLAFPDHLARRCDSGSLMCELRGGKRGELARVSTVRGHDLLVAGEMREVPRSGSTRPLLSLVSAVRREWLEQLFPESWLEEEATEWDSRRRQVVLQRRVTCLGVVLEEQTSADVDAVEAAAILAGRVKAGELVLRGWTKDVEAWMQRARWVAGMFPERSLLTYDDTDMDVILQEVCSGARRYKDIRDVPCLDLVRHALSWDDQQFVEKMAPPWIRLPTGRRMRLQYIPGQPVKGKAPIQDLFDVSRHPHVAGGRERVLLEILAPNMRTVQITQDLPGFWADIYPRVKQELARRYPKHEWR